MGDELHHECGIAALYWLDKPAGSGGAASRAVSNGDVASLMPPMLLDVQNRGQLAAGLTSYNPNRAQLLGTYKDIGTVTEAFRMSHPGKYRAILSQFAGRAVIGHTRYSTFGGDDTRHAQPFERHHGRLWKWFSFAWNGNLANFSELRDRLLARQHYHFTLNTDTEMVMHALAYRLRGEKPVDLRSVMASLARDFDGCYNIVFLDGMGRMFAARDPLGFRPLCWAAQGSLFAVASESVALANMGFTNIRDIVPGEMAVVERGKLRFARFARPRRHSHCFFEWIYFSNVGSTIAETSVYVARARAGRRLAELETERIDDSCIVVPVPDTAKAAGDAFAFKLGVPSVEGLIRNRYMGRTFIEPNSTRGRRALAKYTPLPAVLAGKRVFLVEDSIVRSTTLAALAGQIRNRGKAAEIHVRVACPPIVAPCFYGIDMSTLGELFAPKFVPKAYDGTPSPAMTARMAKTLGVDSLRYLPVAELGGICGIEGRRLCTGCVIGKYPTKSGNALLRLARRNVKRGKSGRTYE